MHEVVANRLVPQCKRICGAVIDRVTYDVLRGEAAADEIEDPNFYLGGEVVLAFRNSEPLYVSWGRIACEHREVIYSLALGADSLFNAGSLQSFCASATRIWSSHIGRTVTEVALYGTDGVPFVLSIQTESGTILIGSSCRDDFGDGDDVFISTDSKSMVSLSQIWRSQSTASPKSD